MQPISLPGDLSVPSLFQLESAAVRAATIAASLLLQVPPAKKPPPAVSTSVGVSPVAALTAALHAKVLRLWICFRVFHKS